MADEQHEEQVVSEDIFDKVAEELGEDPTQLATAEVEDQEEKPKKSQKKADAPAETPKKRRKKGDAEVVAEEGSKDEQAETEQSDPEVAQAAEAEEEKPKKSEKKKKGSPTPPNPAKAKRKKHEKSLAAKIHGKRYGAAAAKVEDRAYEIGEAVALLKETATTTFDSSIEVHLRLGLDPKYQDQQLRATVSLPHGSGKTLRVAVIAGLDKQQEARKAGADEVGEDELIKKIDNGFLDFDVLVATPDAMGKIGRLGKILGTKGLMPNPKAGTVTPDVGKAVGEIKKGRVEFRIDKDGNLHQVVGKASFETPKLEENIRTLLQAIMQNKPSGAKGTYVRGIFLTSTMGPSIRLETQKTLSNL